MIQSHPEYSKTPTSFIKDELDMFGESYCDECGSAEGTFHIRSARCKYAIQGRKLWEENKDGHFKEVGKFTTYYRDPFNGWHEYHLMEYRDNPEYKCRVCGKGTYSKGRLCNEHEKKLNDKLRKSRQMFKQAREEAQIAELEFYSYQTIKKAIEIESDKK
jgi:hypothetical protein